MIIEPSAPSPIGANNPGRPTGTRKQPIQPFNRPKA
nr:MAG TPA: hypothetical protein [Caudoviricetes sp.]